MPAVKYVPIAFHVDDTFPDLFYAHSNGFYTGSYEVCEDKVIA